MGNFLGWECPRCFKIHSPFSLTCDCPPNTFTTTGSSTIHFDFKQCNHKWIRTTKNYKRIKRCSECGEIKQSELFEGAKPLGEFEQKVLNETYKKSLKKTPTRKRN